MTRHFWRRWPASELSQERWHARLWSSCSARSRRSCSSMPIRIRQTLSSCPTTRFASSTLERSAAFRRRSARYCANFSTTLSREISGGWSIARSACSGRFRLWTSKGSAMSWKKSTPTGSMRCTAKMQWWEKSSAQAWLRFLEVAREFRIPASGEMIQFFRTSFSYDAIITRLDKNLDVASALQAYARQAAREARQRVQSGLRKRRWGLTDMDYLQLEEFGDMVTQGIFQLQRNIENPIIHFKNIVGKIAYIASLFLKLGYLVAALFGFGLIAGAIARRWFGYELHLDTLLQQAMGSGWLLLGGVALILVVIRRIVIRLSLPDTRLNPE